MPSQWRAVLSFRQGRSLSFKTCPAVPLARESGRAHHSGAATALRQGERLISDRPPRCQRNTRCINLGVVQNYQVTSCKCGLSARGILLFIYLYIPSYIPTPICCLSSYYFTTTSRHVATTTLTPPRPFSLFQSAYTHLGGTLSALQP